MIQYDIFIKNCETLIRSGNITAASRQLSSLNYSKVPRQWRLPLAKLSRRAGLFTSGLKLLTPLMHAGDKRLRLVPSGQELAEYAACLQVNGSINEAIQVLKKVAGEDVPDALLYQAWCHFSRWEYESAVPHLEKYLRCPLTPYWKLVGSVNLAAAKAMLKHHHSALELVQFALSESSKEGLTRLHANGLELRAQLHLQQGEFSKAEDDLEEALRYLGMAKVQETVFIKKWQAYIEARRTQCLHPFLVLKTEAKKLARWEVLREADLFSLMIQFDYQQFEHLIYGTPYPAYQDRVTAELGCSPIGSHAVLGDEGAPCFDILKGEMDGRCLLKVGCKVHQTLEILLRDFYRPIGLGGLFSELFSGEPFNIYSSPGRIHQILRRTRGWLVSNNLPLSLSQNKGLYSLRANKPFSFQVPLRKQKIDWGEFHFNNLKKSLGGHNKISPSQIKNSLGMTQDEYRRFYNWAIGEQRLRRVHDGSTVFYEFVNDKKAS